MTEEMKALLKKIADLCYRASEEVYENEETKEILNSCDKLQEMIDRYLEKELEEIKYYELRYFHGRKDNGSICIKTALDKDLYCEDEFLQMLVNRNELDASEVDAIIEIEEIDEETYDDMTGK